MRDLLKRLEQLEDARSFAIEPHYVFVSFVDTKQSASDCNVAQGGVPRRLVRREEDEDFEQFKDRAMAEIPVNEFGAAVILFDSRD